MSKSEIGEIVTIVKGARPQYQVRLAHGEIVVVEQSQIEPQRTTLLPRGARLRITHELGRVQSASTDLGLIVRGRVKTTLHTAQRTTYRLELDQGDPLTVDRSLISPHPERDLLAGAVVEIHFEAGKAKAIRLVSEREACVMVQLEMQAGTASLQCESGERYTVRLAADALRQLRIGEKLVLEIQYSPEGQRKIVLERPASGASAASPAQPLAASPARKKKPAETDRRPAPISPPPPGKTPTPLAEADALGIDPAYLERIRREGHRFEIVSFLEQHAHDGLIEWYRLRKGRAAQFTQPARPLAANLLQAVRTALPSFKGFYRHQALALDAIRAEHNLVIVTQTASGKTLSYNPAIFEYLASHPNGHVLYLFPLNALMTDQKEKIDDLVNALSKCGINLSAEILVGGMGSQRDEIARSSPNILATNPEMLSVILGEAKTKWVRFFSGLKYIIIDEVHTYRGIFGVHVAGLVRRLLLTARRSGANPLFILSSATISNPGDLAARLTSLPETSFELLNTGVDGSQQADKHWAILNPDLDSRRSHFNNYQEVAAEAFVELLTRKDASGKPSPLNTILFCRSIREVKTISRLIEHRLQQRARHLVNKIRTYVSAELTSEAKREIYDGLRSGKYLGVISTNALEAGIDIGHLDACIITGFPFSVMAIRQMAGRVGRQEEGLVLFVPYPLNPLDQYYRDHPEQLLDQPPEVFVVDPHNPYIARKHINAAAYHLGGLSAIELNQYWGERAVQIAAAAQKDGVMRLSGDRWTGTRRNFNDSEDVYAVRSLRSNIQQPYAVCLEDDQPCPSGPECFDPAGRRCPRRITLLDRQYIYRDCHPGAIYEATDGRLYRVTRFDDAALIVKVSELHDGATERTYAEEDLTVEISGPPRGRKSLQPGIELFWGDVTVTRLFTGYHRYNLQLARRCRRCRREYDETIESCPLCHHPTEVYYAHTRAEHLDFPPPYQLGFQIVLKTVACWLTLRPEVENNLVPASPCKLPGSQNRVLSWLMSPLNLARLSPRLRLTEAEKSLIESYHAQAARQIEGTHPTPQEALLFPGIYSQCLLSQLRSQMTESRSLEIFQALTGYPVTDDLRHICRDCQTSMLFPALHTIEHAVEARYPSVALGDRSDLGAYTTLGHSATGLPTVFWFDNYEGGLGAAEKVFEQFTRLLETGLDALQGCSCTTLEGCPRCTYIPDCDSGNEELSKSAGSHLIAMILGRTLPPPLQPYLYRKKRAAEFDRDYQKNEKAAAPRGQAEEAPQSTPPDPYYILRLQQQVHSSVANKAFEVRSRELDRETPPISAVELNNAYQKVLTGPLQKDWQLDKKNSPYEVMEVLPGASLEMVKHIYRVIALQVHPDANPTRAAWANEMMKRLNEAYGRIIKER